MDDAVDILTTSNVQSMATSTHMTRAYESKPLEPRAKLPLYISPSHPACQSSRLLLFLFDCCRWSFFAFLKLTLPCQHGVLLFLKGTSAKESTLWNQGMSKIVELLSRRFIRNMNVNPLHSLPGAAHISCLECSFAISTEYAPREMSAFGVSRVVSSE